jgi:hypothetical protein
MTSSGTELLVAYSERQKKLCLQIEKLRDELDHFVEENAYINAQILLGMKLLHEETKKSRKKGKFVFTADLENIASKPVMIENIASEPVMIEPVMIENITSKLVIAEPVMIEPVMIENSTSKLVIAEPVMIEPVMIENSTSKLVIAEPVMIENITSKPVMIKPVNDWVVVKKGPKPQTVTIVPEPEPENKETQEIVEEKIITKQKKSKHTKQAKTKKITNEDSFEDSIDDAAVISATHLKNVHDTLKTHLTIDCVSCKVIVKFIKTLLTENFLKKHAAFARYTDTHTTVQNLTGDSIQNADIMIKSTAVIYFNAIKALSLINFDPNNELLWNYFKNIHKAFMLQIDKFVELFQESFPIQVIFKIRDGVSTIHDLYHSLQHTSDMILFLLVQQKNLVENRKIFIEPHIPKYNEKCQILAENKHRDYVKMCKKFQKGIIFTRPEPDTFIVTQSELQKHFKHMKIPDIPHSVVHNTGVQLYDSFCGEYEKVKESDLKSTVYELNYDDMSEETKTVVKNAHLEKRTLQLQ